MRALGGGWRFNVLGAGCSLWDVPLFQFSYPRVLDYMSGESGDAEFCAAGPLTWRS